MDPEILAVTSSHTTHKLKFSGSTCVSKTFPADPKSRATLIRSIGVLKNVKLERVLAVKDCYSVEEGLAVVVEYAEKSDLAAYARGKELREEMVLRILWQMLTAVKEVHGRSMQEVGRGEGALEHRYLCTRNVFLKTDGVVKLAELVNLVLGGDNLTSLYKEDCSLYAYRAPETFARLFSPASDIWSLGVIAYELCTRSLPFPAQTKAQFLQLFSSPLRLSFPPNSYSLQLQQIITQMLTFEPENRPSADELLHNSLFHPIFLDWRLVDGLIFFKKWSPKLINWKEEVKISTLTVITKDEKDFEFPIPSPPVAEPVSPQIPDLRGKLVQKLGLLRFNSALMIVKRLFGSMQSGKYMTKNYEQALREVLDRQLLVEVLPLLKILAIREGGEGSSPVRRRLGRQNTPQFKQE